MTAAWRSAFAAAVAARAGDVVPLTRRLVGAPSPNPPGDERAAAAVVDDYLADLRGIARDVLGPAPERPSLVFGHGTGLPTLALSAHLDTHAVHGAWETDPFVAEERDGRLVGLGTTDIKGAVAAMAVVFRAAVEAGPCPGRLLLIANADEETGGTQGIEAIRDALPLRPDAVVVAEPSGIAEPFERLYVAARGTSRFRITAGGVETHSSLDDHPGVVNAVRELERLLAAFRARLPILDRPHPLYGLGPVLIPVRVEGGRGYGMVPGSASSVLELRLTPGHARAEVEQLVAEALAAASAETGTAATLEFAEGGLRWMAPSEVAGDDPVVVAARRAWADVFGIEPALGCFPGGTDARLYTERGIPALAGVGPGALIRAHHPNEFVTVAELELAVRLYAAIVTRYLDPEETT